MKRDHSILTAAALAAGLLTLSAISAFAAERVPEMTIKSECKEAGGTYVTGMSGDKQYSSCAYNDITGGAFVDTYENGTYTGTLG